MVNNSFSVQALHFLSYKDVGIHFVSGGGRCVGSVDTRSGSIQRRICQYQALTDGTFYLEMEVFRVPLVYIPVVTSINRNQWDESADFDIQGQQVCLSDEGRRKFITFYEQRKAETWKHPVTGYSLEVMKITITSESRSPSFENKKNMVEIYLQTILLLVKKTLNLLLYSPDTVRGLFWLIITVICQ
ncbi:MAG: CRISPR-associated endonuclease Cas1 [Microcystaceae cyanobacterium]